MSEPNSSLPSAPQPNEEGLVLSGGGAFGAYEVGVLKALAERDSFHPTILTGTSVGAFNAAILATQSVRRLEQIWLEEIAGTGLLSPNGALRIRGLPQFGGARVGDNVANLFRDSLFAARFSFERSMVSMFSGGTLASRASEWMDLSSLVSVEPLRKLIAKTVSLRAIRASSRKLSIIATDWQAGAMKMFSNRDLSDELGGSMIMASTAIPGIFPPVEMNGRLYVDGGVVMNTPLKPALKAGASRLHVISLDPVVKYADPSELDNSIEAMMRSVQLMIGSAITEDMATAEWINAGLRATERARAGEELRNEDLRDFVRVAAQFEEKAREGQPFRLLTIHHYQPEHPLGGPMGMLDFRLGTIRRYIERGYADTLQHRCRHCVTAAQVKTASG